MDGTSCDRHTGSLDEPRNRWPSGLQQIQVLPRSFGHGTGGWGVSGTWSPVVFILGPCHDWSDLATDTTGLGKKWVFFVQWAGKYIWRCINQWRCEQLTLEDLQRVDGWWAGELSHYCWKNVIPTTMDSQWICFTLQQHQHPQIPDSTKNWGSWSHIDQEAGSLLKGPLFEAPMKGGGSGMMSKFGLLGMGSLHSHRLILRGIEFTWFWMTHYSGDTFFHSAFEKNQESQENLLENFPQFLVSNVGKQRRAESRTPKHKTILRSSAWTCVIWLYTPMTRDLDCMFSCTVAYAYARLLNFTWISNLVFLSHNIKRCNAQ